MGYVVIYSKSLLTVFWVTKTIRLRSSLYFHVETIIDGVGT